MSSLNEIALHVESVTGVKLTVSEGETASLDIGGSFYAVGPPFYDGPYEVTPSSEAQTLHMEGMRASADVTVKPIPSNYGLITWNGSTITVS